MSRLSGLLILIGFMACSEAYSDSISTFKKNSIRYKSKYSDRHSYYEENAGVVHKDSKAPGISTNGPRGFGEIQNWVEIKNRPGGGYSGKALGISGGYKSPRKKVVGGKNLGVKGKCKRGLRIDNTVIIKNSNVGGSANSGVFLNGCKSSSPSRIKNSVTIQRSKIGNSAALR